MTDEGRHRLQVFIPRDLWRQLKVAAAEADTPAGELVSQLLAEGLNRRGKQP